MRIRRKGKKEKKRKEKHARKVARLDVRLLVRIPAYIILLLCMFMVITQCMHSRSFIEGEILNVKIKIPYAPLRPKFLIELIMLSVVFVAPSAIYEYNRFKLLYRIEDQLPIVTRIVADALRTGTVIEDALNLIARSGMYPINTIIGRALLLSKYKSIPVPEALRILGSEIGAEGIIRFADLLDLAYRYGARAEDILDVAAYTMESIQSYRRERMVNLRPYVALIYMMVFVYLFICGIIAILSSFQIPQTFTTAPGSIRLEINTEYLDAMISIVEYITLINCAGASLIIGRIVYERPLAGLIHYMVLAPTTYMFLLVLKLVLAKMFVPSIHLTII
ncbi:MAG: hypothetical protein GXO10_01110 [Crenarchaeota archaeon]|nr:hypothetical protein [Thermoproteota archaeon]